MKPYFIKKNPSFVGRVNEINKLDEIQAKEQASFIAVYGRRRVGKTELIEQYFRNHQVLKFEGIELPPEDKRSAEKRREFQIQQCLHRLSQYMEKPLLKKLDIKLWTEFFEILDECKQRKKIVFYFEEVQWLADYGADFFSELKPFWDDSWRHQPSLSLLVCGSSTSFIVKQLLSNKALYGRVQDQIHLKPLSLFEIQQYLEPLGKNESMMAALTVGGIPQYLGLLKEKGLVLTNLCKHSFLPSSVLANEKDKIFVSSLKNNKHYEEVIYFLSKRKMATIPQIVKALKGNEKSGGTFSQVLEELIDCGFIEKNIPLHKNENSKLIRYSISDEYLQWYYKFIHSKRKDIESGKFVDDPLKALNRKSFEIILGLNFERWCRKNTHLFARIMGFSGVDYVSGPYFDKKTESKLAGFQIDLLYIIKGNKIVVCEIKYGESSLRPSVCEQVREKIALFQETMPQFKDYTYESVLITAGSLKLGKIIDLAFDRIITLRDIFDDRYG